MTGIDCCLSREFHVCSAWRGRLRYHDHVVTTQRNIVAEGRSLKRRLRPEFTFRGSCFKIESVIGSAVLIVITVMRGLLPLQANMLEVVWRATNG